MIPFAGIDTTERPIHVLRRKPRKQERAYRMFRAGKDTAFIAAHFKITEARALKWITLERSAVHSLPNPYEACA